MDHPLWDAAMAAESYIQEAADSMESAVLELERVRLYPDILTDTIYAERVRVVRQIADRVNALAGAFHLEMHSVVSGRREEQAQRKLDRLAQLRAQVEELEDDIAPEILEREIAPPGC